MLMAKRMLWLMPYPGSHKFQLCQYHQELEEMKEQYASDEDFATIFEQLMNVQHNEHYLLKGLCMESYVLPSH